MSVLEVRGFVEGEGLGVDMMRNASISMRLRFGRGWEGEEGEVMMHVQAV